MNSFGRLINSFGWLMNSFGWLVYGIALIKSQNSFMVIKQNFNSHPELQLFQKLSFIINITVKRVKNKGMTESVKVMVRCRPMNLKQIERDSKDVIIVDKITHQIGLKKISPINTTVKNFAYDYVFAQDSTQQQVYEQSSFSLVQNVLNGYNGTIFAYGQTGCGKTHTMLGVTTTLSTKKAQMINNTKQNLPVTVTSLKLQQSTMGIIPRAFNQIMTVTNSQTNKNHLIQCTFIEIYNQQIHDLLGKDIRAKINLQQTPDGLIMKDLSVHLAKNVSDMEKYMEIGYKNRVIRQTSMNKESSRSHCIFTIRIEESEYDFNGVQKFRVGKLNLVDLAGSQRQSKTNLKDQGIKQAAKINLSLSALGNVISALVDGKKQHIPYRDSKLTRILNDSLGGNTKTVMIATISPADYNYEETLSTLRYSSRAKFIQNKPIINEDPKDALLRKYEEQIRRLKMILEGKLPYLRGNQTIYINNKDQKNQLNIFKKFPELQNQQNQAIMDRMNEMNQVSLSIQKALKEHDNEINDPYNLHQLTDKQQTNNSIQIMPPNQQLEELKKQLQFLQEIVKKQINTSPEVLSELNKINQLKQKLREQALKEQQYKQQEVKREQQLLNIQKNYKNLNEQVDSIKIKFEDLRVKYVQTSQELKDARQAHEIEKEEILDALRIQQAQNNKLMQILNVILPSNELQKIFKNCEWKDNAKEWVVPKFNFSQKNGVTVAKKGDKGFSLFSYNKAEKQLQRVEKQKSHRKSTVNLIVEQTMQRNMRETRKMNQSDKKVGESRKMGSSEKIMPLSRNQTDKQETDKNLYKSVQKQRQKTFKNSYYSDSTRPEGNYSNVNGNYQSLNSNNNNNKPRSNSTNKTDQKKVLDKYKLSLGPLPKIKVQEEKQRPEKVSLDMEQIKRQIMKEMMEKNRNAKKNNH